VVTVTLLDEE
jgi:hypothetical protein